MLIQVESVNLTKSGKAYMVNRKWVAPLSSGIEQTVGKQIDAKLGSFTAAGGKEVETIEGFTESSSQPATAFKSPQNGAGGVSSTDRWYMPFVSNICAHAIQSGLVTTPKELEVWAKTAKICARMAELENGQPEPSEDKPDDDIPY